MVVAEAVLNLACAGARPLALVNCLNFGNPEHPEVMWQLSEADRRHRPTACRVLDIPVVGGNVSLYNESRGRDIDPTPIVGLLGAVDRLDRPPPGLALEEGTRLFLVGAPGAGLAGSRWAWARGERGGELPELDLDHHARVAALVRAAVAGGFLAAVHDVADGGLVLALAEMAVAGETGFRVSPPPAVDVIDWLFGEAPSRVVAAVAPALVDRFEAAAADHGVAVTEIGAAGGADLAVDGILQLPLAEAIATWRDRLPAALGHGTAQG